MLDADGNILFNKLDEMGIKPMGLTNDIGQNYICFFATKVVPCVVKVRLKANGEVIDQQVVEQPYVKVNTDRSVDYTIAVNPIN